MFLYTEIFYRIIMLFSHISAVLLLQNLVVLLKWNVDSLVENTFFFLSNSIIENINI